MQQTPELARAAFNEAYASLNAAQKQAVATIDGPVMVIAGPGTGKTQVLTLRIANILLQTDTAPESILALTFTESGARTMRTRLHRYVGSEAYRVAIFTFHGFAQQLIQRYPDAYERVIGGRPATDLDQVGIIEDILSDPAFIKLRPAGNPDYYVGPLRRTISDLKREYIQPTGLAELLKEEERVLAATKQYHEKGPHQGKVRGEYTKLSERLAKNRELLAVYQRYEALLRERHLYDYDDMIVETVSALDANESMLRDLQEQYQYVLADEHQDVNGAQNKILELLTNFHSTPNIFVVGDEKQAIFRFQGASLENFLYFQDHYQGTVVIQLTDNYRSGQTILDVAHSLVAVPDGPMAPLRVPLCAQSVSESTVDRHHYQHQAIEDEAIIQDIKAQVAAGTPPAEIAVIVRTNREVESLALELRRASLPVAATAEGDILAHPITYAIEALLEAVEGRNGESALVSVLHGSYWKISLSDLMLLLSLRRADKPLTSLLSDEQQLAAAGIRDVPTIRKVLTVLETARTKQVTEPPHRVLEYLLQASGFLDHVMIHDPIDGTRVIRRLYDEVEALVRRDGIATLHAVSETIARQRAYAIPLTAPFITTENQAIQLMTAHKSKGLEFDVVYVPHLQDNNWGGVIKRNIFTISTTPQLRSDVSDTADDEHRLLYVAMTRARYRLWLSSADTNNEGRALLPSRLFDDLNTTLLTIKGTTDMAMAYQPISILTIPIQPQHPGRGTLLNYLSERGFSATSFNNYLGNPFDFLYRNVLRLPEVQSLPLQFGTVIHDVLEFATRHNTINHKLPSDSAIKNQLELALGRLPLGVNEFTRLLEKGLNVLYPYLSHLTNQLPVLTKEEFKLRVLLETGLPELPQLPLTGKLDRLDFDEQGLLKQVVDYKTGAAKTRNAIMGKTANSDGGYYRQLTFYALLLSLYDDSRYHCRNGVLSFVEPDQRGRIHEEAFVVDDVAIAALTEDIIGAVRSILKGDFLSDQALAESSSYAPLATQLVALGRI